MDSVMKGLVGACMCPQNVLATTAPADVGHWSASRRLKLNPNKSEVILLGTRQQPSPARQIRHCSSPTAS